MSSENKMNLILEFRKILYGDKQESTRKKNDRGNENAIQEFMEKHSELIPTPHLTPGGIFCNTVISKYQISKNLITDFAYISILSGNVHITLIELESSTKKIFLKNNTQGFHSDFTSAFYQVNSWRRYLTNYKEKADPLKDLKCFLPEEIRNHAPRINYLLIISGALPTGQEYRQTLESHSQSINIDIWTYEDIISALPYSTGKKNILSKASNQLIVKHLSRAHRGLLDNMTPATLTFGPETIKSLDTQTKEQVKLWQQNRPPKTDPWKVKALGRYGDRGSSTSLDTEQQMEAFIRSSNCCEWPGCENRLFNGFDSFEGSFITHKYQVLSLFSPYFVSETERYRNEYKTKAYCINHTNYLPLDNHGFSTLPPDPATCHQERQAFDVEIDSLARKAILRYLIQHCLPKNLLGLGSTHEFSDIEVYKATTNWLMAMIDIQGYYREMYLYLFYSANFKYNECYVNPYRAVNSEVFSSFNPARYSRILLNEYSLLVGAINDHDHTMASWQLRTSTESGIKLNSVFHAIQQSFTQQELAWMLNRRNLKRIENTNYAQTLDLLPYWLEG
ncbi:Shedu anti-phage system protein SduA domain-containing protein [Azotobacter bryophylli]|uniref:Shedu anti-phage system protein SduA domain-containing protein n=1 Tax=Azotobacter bryophylli TaxID=1986537 RepID=A0ABV7B009_9GAMM